MTDLAFDFDFMTHKLAFLRLLDSGTDHTVIRSVVHMSEINILMNRSYSDEAD